MTAEVPVVVVSPYITIPGGGGSGSHRPPIVSGAPPSTVGQPPSSEASASSEAPASHIGGGGGGLPQRCSSTCTRPLPDGPSISRRRISPDPGTFVVIVVSRGFSLPSRASVAGPGRSGVGSFAGQVPL